MINTEPVTVFCLDSNIVSDILRHDENVLRNLEKETSLGNRLAICSIVYYEIERGLRVSGATKRLKDFHRLYESLLHLPLDDYAIDIAADIYVELHKGKQIEDADIFIAAIAMANDCVLATDNVKHFKRIQKLKFVNWRE